MDSLSGIREPVPDVGAVERAGDGRWQAGGQSKGSARRRARKSELMPMTASDDGSESPAGKDGSPLPGDPSEKAPAGGELSVTCYGANRAMAPVPPSKGRVIDIAI